jgi:hypothetical protein
MAFNPATDLPSRERELIRVMKEAVDEYLEGTTGASRAADSIKRDLEQEITGIYNPFLDIPDPADFATEVMNLGKALEQLTPYGYNEKQKDSGGHPVNHSANTTLQQVSSTGDHIQDWTGDAASAFKDEYGDKFVPVMGSQFNAYYVTRHAINAEAAVWQTAREDLDELSKDAIDQMRHVNDSTKDDWEAGLKVAAAVVGIAGAVATSPISSWAAVGAGVAVAVTGVEVVGKSGESKKEPLNNASPGAIVESLQAALGKIKTEIYNNELEIRNAVSGSLKAINDAPHDFLLKRPKLADAPHDSGIFGNDNLGHA